MHDDCKIAHLDLKPENILLTGDLNIKICDFGCSQSLQSMIYNDYGTPQYKAPEISSRQRLCFGYSGETADIFSLGVNLFILHFGVPPFSKAN
jgi:serine/threonine protein kinase